MAIKTEEREGLRYEAVVRQLVVEELGLAGAKSIGLHDDLRSVGLDSFNCMELTVLIEDTLNISIPDEKLGMKQVSNIQSICNLIEEAMGDVL